MKNISLLEECFNKFTKNITHWLPEGVIEVDIHTLQKFGLLSFHGNRGKVEDSLTRYFKVLESSEKITLINDEFIVWIVPENNSEYPVTYTLIALNDGDHPHLELAFSTSGVYNTSRLVLHILEKFLLEIQENESLLKKYKTG